MEASAAGFVFVLIARSPLFGRAKCPPWCDTLLSYAAEGSPPERTIGVFSEFARKLTSKENGSTAWHLN